MKTYFKQLHWQILIAMLLGVSLTFLLPPKEEIKVNDASEIKDKVVELKLVNVDKEQIKEVVSYCSDCKLIYNKNTNTFTIQSDKGINIAVLKTIFLIPDLKIISTYKEINSFNKYRRTFTVYFMSKILCSPFVALPPACSIIKARGLHS